MSTFHFDYLKAIAKKENKKFFNNFCVFSLMFIFILLNTIMMPTMFDDKKEVWKKISSTLKIKRGRIIILR